MNKINLNKIKLITFTTYKPKGPEFKKLSYSLFIQLLIQLI